MKDFQDSFQINIEVKIRQVMDFLKKRDGEAIKSAVTIHLHHAVQHEKISF